MGNCVVLVLFHLTDFTEPNTLPLHPCCCKWQYFIYLWPSSSPLCRCATSSLSSHPLKNTEVPYDFTQMWGPKQKAANEQTQQTKTALQTQTTEWWLPEGKGVKYKVTEGD